MNWDTTRDLMAYALELMQQGRQAQAVELLELIQCTT